MHLEWCIVFILFVYSVECRNNVKSLTDSLGQEVIEIGTPIKELQELPPGVEEEPSAEVDEEVTSKQPPQPATRRETKRVVTTTTTTTSTKPKEVDTEESVSQEDEETRIEKELAEIYKDTDYKSESSESIKPLKLDANKTDGKLVARTKINFKFQPDTNSREGINWFRTSVDEISCDRRVTQKLNTEVSKSQSANQFLMSFIRIGSLALFLLVCY